MANADRTAKLRALLVLLRSQPFADTEPVESPLDWVKDKLLVTHRTLAVRCADLLTVCGDQPFCVDLQKLKRVLERETDLTSVKYDNILLTAMLWNRMKGEMVAYARVLTNTPKGDIEQVEAKVKNLKTSVGKAFYKLHIDMNTYAMKHKEQFDRSIDEETQKILEYNLQHG
jgi:hypothetical protein